MLSERLDWLGKSLRGYGLPTLASEAAALAGVARGMEIELAATRRQGLTPQLARCKAVIERLTDGAGVAPSYAEIAAELGHGSKSRVHDLVRRLAERGHVRYSRSARSIVVIRGGSDAQR